VAAWLLIDRGESSAEQGSVTRVVDGDTLRVRIDGSAERVRLIGINAPERGECFYARATELLQSLTQGRVVTVQGDSTQRPRDRYGRLLAYVRLPDAADAGEVLLQRGAAVVFETRRPFARREAYVDAQATATRRGAGLHGACR
jgi:micrococcal nuclease